MSKHFVASTSLRYCFVIDIYVYIFTCRFCSQLGALFSFVVNDLQDKIGHLNMLIDEDEQNFSTVNNMILHERSNNLLKGDSGCITLLRLHRGLGIVFKLYPICFWFYV